MLILDENGCVLEANPEVLNVLELNSREEIIGKSILPYIVREHLGAVKQTLHDVFKGRSGFVLYEARGARGKVTRREMHAAPLKDSKGNIIAFIGISREVREN